MENWIVTAIISLVIYGFWGFFPKLAVSYINPVSALIFQVAGAMVIGLFCLALTGFHPETHPRGILFALLTGISGVLGTLFYFMAASRGKIGVVVSITALYPLITILLAFFFLKEPLTFKQLLGMFFSLVAILLFTT
jgi:transporter family protein